MKKTFIIPMLALATLGMVACGGNQPASSAITQQTSTSTKAPFVLDSVTINNKEDLGKLWRVGFDNRALTLTVKDAAGKEGNPAALISEGTLVVTSSNEAAVKPMGLTLVALAPGKATITVASGEKKDTVEVEVKEKRSEAGVDAILEEFKDLAKSAYTEESVPMVGIVSRYETFYNAKDKNITVWVKDAGENASGKEIELYKVPAAKGVDISDLIPGDTVHVEGKIQNYNGTFEYTAAGSITKVDKIARPTPATRPEPTPATIAELAAKTEKEMGVEYKVSGIWENGKGDDYGNGYLTDPETGKSIQVYGSTGTASAIAFNGLTGSPLYTFTNPKDAKSGDMTKDLANGMKVEANALNITYVSSDGKTITPEVALVITKKEAVTDKYAASVADVENGTVTLSKTEDLAYGEEVTVTTTVADGYKLSKLVVDHGYGKEDITESKKFKATAANKVIATIEADLPEGWSEANFNTTKWAEAETPTSGTTKLLEYAIDDKASFTIEASDANTGKLYGPGNATGLWEIRCYKSGSAKLTVSVAEGFTLEKVVVSMAKSNWGAPADETLTIADNVAVIDSSADGINSNFNIKGIKVQYSVTAAE